MPKTIRSNISLFIKKWLFFNTKSNRELRSLVDQFQETTKSLPEDFPSIITIESSLIRELITHIVDRDKKILDQEKKINSLIVSNAVNFEEMSHNFRTPFNAILGFTGLLTDALDGIMNEDQAKMFTIINSSIKALNDKFSYMLAFHKSRNNHNTTLNEILELTENFYSSKLEEKKIKLSFNIIENTLLNIPGLDLMNILDNLLDNAIKFSNKNTTIFVSCKLHGELSHVSVSNVGKPYRGTNELGTSGEKGTGTGLLRIQSLLEKNGSKLVINAEGPKTTMSFNLSKKTNIKR